jgi:hypothetical protein
MLRWRDDLPPVNRDSGGTTATGATDRPGGRPGREIAEALIVAAVAVALIALVIVVATVIHT